MRRKIGGKKRMEREKAKARKRGRRRKGDEGKRGVRSLVSWCFELSQPQRITSGLRKRGDEEEEAE